jgi:hypothetical protein
MKHLLIVCLALSASLSAMAGSGPDTLYNTLISAQVHAAGRTNSLPASFYYRFHRGGFLDRPYLERNQEKLKNDNIGGFDYKSGIYIQRRIDSISRHSGFFAGLRLEDRYHVSAAFTRDLYRLAFFGNKVFDGATASAGPFLFRSIAYRYYGIEFGKWFRKGEEQYRLGVELAYLEGRRGIEIDAKRANLSTGTDGRFVQLDVNGYYYESDTTRHSGSRFLWPSTGNGMAGSLSLEWWHPEGHYLNFYARDIGFIDWKRTGIDYQADTSVFFDGFQIPNVITYHDSLFRMSVDSLERLNPEGFRDSRRVMLPSWFGMDYRRDLPELPLSISTGIAARSYSSFRPYIYGGCTWHIRQNAHLSMNIGSGGWGGLNIHSSFDYSFLKSWRLQASLMQMESLFSFRKARGTGMMVGITKKFNYL